jgi:hypothetical protein
MPIESKSGRWVALTAAVLLLCLLVTGCSSITPYQPRNNREEGPERGIFTGSKGEFVIPIPMPEEPAKEDEKAKTTSGEASKSE